MIKKFYEDKTYAQYKIFEDWIRINKKTKSVEQSSDGYNWNEVESDLLTPVQLEGYES